MCSKGICILGVISYHLLKSTTFSKIVTNIFFYSDNFSHTTPNTTVIYDTYRYVFSFADYLV